MQATTSPIDCWFWTGWGASTVEGKLLSSLGKIAGIGGVALGIFLLLFQGVLQQKFMPGTGLDSSHAFAVIMSLMLLTFGVAAIGVFAWLIARTTGPQTPVSGPILTILTALIVLVIAAAVYEGAQAGGDLNPKVTPQAIQTITKLVEDEDRTAWSGGRDEPNPGCQDHDVDSCISPLHGGTFVPRSAAFVTRSMSDPTAIRTNYKLTTDKPYHICFSLHAQTGACETRYEMIGHASGLEQYETNGSL
ncbi:hypothetical protein C8D77_12011 [Mesorhizobium loti]|uniref:Uncharacterized protein n=1 Tax=Rhizobium loti TaxID=381 RepID=A0A8E3B1S9_RHILI|nr:hypothetical protein [Mesorhizobium loti]PWJ86913.1 hypothetical protein C8D77_12011 [Mesorhizobium loti]